MCVCVLGDGVRVFEKKLGMVALRSLVVLVVLCLLGSAVIGRVGKGIEGIEGIERKLGAGIGFLGFWFGFWTVRVGGEEGESGIVLFDTILMVYVCVGVFVNCGACF